MREKVFESRNSKNVYRFQTDVSILWFGIVMLANNTSACHITRLINVGMSDCLNVKTNGC